MTGPLRLGLVAMAAAILLAIAFTSHAGSPSGRSQAAARQQVGHALARATADGRLTPQERDAILSMARERLAPNEFEYLQRRLVGSQPPAPPAPASLTTPPVIEPASRYPLVPRFGGKASLPDVTDASFHRRLKLAHRGERSLGPALSNIRRPAPMPPQNPAPLPDALGYGARLTREALSEGADPPSEVRRVSWGNAPLPASARENTTPGFSDAGAASCSSCRPPQTIAR